MILHELTTQSSLIMQPRKSSFKRMAGVGLCTHARAHKHKATQRGGEMEISYTYENFQLNFNSGGVCMHIKNSSELYQVVIFFHTITILTRHDFNQSLKKQA
uniref:Uncharacterized protein n=1 Tax=Opuntia streptacantha TaxID=393608 RepID=A0A7C8ZSY7_OPUST